MSVPTTPGQYAFSHSFNGVARSDEEVIAMLKDRVHPMRAWPEESVDLAA